MSRRALKNIHRLIEAAQKELPVEQEFLSDLKAAIERSEESRLPSRTYKPSSLICLRNMYFQVIGQQPDEEKADSCLIGICQTGSARHEHLQQAIASMKKLGIDCEYIDVEKFVNSRKPKGTKVVQKQGMETKCYNEILNMSFLCDGIIRYKGRYYILEIKTESLYKWQTRNAPADDHITQASCYSVCLGLDDVIFLYENRDNCDKKCYLVHVTDSMKEERVVGKIAECDSYVQKLIPPPMTENKRACNYCGYKSACRKVGR